MLLPWLLVGALAVAAAVWLAGRVRRSTKAARLEQAATAYARGLLVPGEWPPPYPPDIDAVQELLRGAGLLRQGPEYTGMALRAIRSVCTAHFAQRFPDAGVGREEYFAAYLAAFGRNPGWGTYLHDVMEARLGSGKRTEQSLYDLQEWLTGR